MTEFEQMILDAIKEVKQGIDGIHKKIDGHTEKLSCHETDIELLKKDFQHHTEQPEKAMSWVKSVLQVATSIGGVAGAVAAFWIANNKGNP